MEKLEKKFNVATPKTFVDDRKCLYCDKPICDQEHATREYCEKYYDDLGKVHDCKTDYHRANDKHERLNHSNLINQHRFLTNRISAVVSKKGYNVTTDDLNAYDITLTDSIRFDIKNDGTLISHFLEYIITSNPISNQHTISEHEQ